MNCVPPRSTSDLIARTRSGESLKYLMFWGHTPKGRAIGKECLSQWYPCRFEVAGVAYASAEHFMMASKATLFGDEATCRKILDADSPGEAKALGRSVVGFDPAIWERQRFRIVVEGNCAKFSQNAGPGEFLRATGRRVLVEASPTDRIWGIGLAADHPDASDPTKWRGANLLGFALMAARHRICA